MDLLVERHLHAGAGMSVVQECMHACMQGCRPRRERARVQGLGSGCECDKQHSSTATRHQRDRQRARKGTGTECVTGATGTHDRSRCWSTPGNIVTANAVAGVTGHASRLVTPGDTWQPRRWHGAWYGGVPVRRPATRRAAGDHQGHARGRNSMHAVQWVHGQAVGTSQRRAQASS